MRCLKNIISSCLCLALLVGCKENLRFHSSEIERTASAVEVQRFDRDFWDMDSLSLAQKYDEFVPLYVHQIMQLPPSQVEVFKQDSAFGALRHQADSVFASTDAIAQRIGVAFAYLQHYFPAMQLPVVSFHVSGFNQSVVTTSDRVSVSIDNYMGEDYSLYPQIAYQYEVPFMTSRHVPIDVLLGWLSSEFPDTTGRLLETMIYHGKLMYLLQVCFPEETMAELLSYTEDQLQWCLRYEKNIWAMLIEQRDLYSTDWRIITRYTQPAPFTNGLSQEHSPGRVGVFVGWRIVSSYMEQNQLVSLQDLMNEQDAQKILQLSGYRP